MNKYYFSGQIHNFQILVGNDALNIPDSTTDTDFYPKEIDFSTIYYGQTVRIRRQNDVITICEVRVFAGTLYTIMQNYTVLFNYYFVPSALSMKM